MAQEMSATDLRLELFVAIRKNNIEGVKKLLSRRQQLPLTELDMDYHALRRAIRFNRMQMANLLVDNDFRVCLSEAEEDSPLHLAVVRPRFYSLVIKILQRNASLSQRNRNNETPIHKAFHGGASGRVIQLLLDTHQMESFRNEVTDHGLTYLHIACAKTNIQCVRRFLIEGNADVNAQITKDCSLQYAGSTPLHMAVEFGKLDIALYLLEIGADIYLTDAEGSTPIHIALERGNSKMIDLLFKYDQKRCNAYNKHGVSHFMAACASRRTKFVIDFLENNENAGVLFSEIVDSRIKHDYVLNGYCAIDIAKDYNRPEIMAILFTEKPD